MAACRNCGKEVAASSWRCYQCGSEVPTDSVMWGKIGLAVMVVGGAIWFLYALGAF